MNSDPGVIMPPCSMSVSTSAWVAMPNSFVRVVVALLPCPGSVWIAVPVGVPSVSVASPVC